MTQKLKCGATLIDDAVSNVNCGGTATTAVHCGGTLVYDVAASGTAPIITCVGGTVIFPINVAGTLAAPTNTGDPVQAGGWSISPALPIGKSMDANTGIISGTATVVSPVTVYTVTAVNATGSDTCTFSAEVTLALPNIVCPANMILPVGDAFAAFSSTNSGGAIQAGGWSVSPALPANVSLDSNTGVITGTPTPSAETVNTTYTITAANATGTDSCTFDLETPLDPVISCPANASLIVGTAYSSTVPSNTGGAVLAGGWSVAPGLPTGLSINTNTGVISGTPTAATVNATYTITATNNAGSDTCTFTIDVAAALLAPSIVCAGNQTLTIAAAMTGVSPVNSGGAVPAAGYSIAPALPTGLAFNTSTGAITGTPTNAQTATNYTITATNTTGSDTCTIGITIPLLVPSATMACGIFVRTSGGQANINFEFDAVGGFNVNSGGSTAGPTQSRTWLPAGASITDYEVQITRDLSAGAAAHCTPVNVGPIIRAFSLANIPTNTTQAVLLGSLAYHRYSMEFRPAGGGATVATLHIAYEADAT